MYSVTNSFGLNGLRGFAVAVEADVSGGLPAFSIFGGLVDLNCASRKIFGHKYIFVSL